MNLRIKDYTTKVGSGVTPKGGAETYLSSGIPLFRSQNVHNYGFLLDDIAYISEETDEQMRGSRVYSGDVLLNITGASIGRCYFTSDEFKGGNVNQHVCIIRPNKKIVKPAFLHYLLISNKGQMFIDLSQTGANRQGLTIEDIRNFSFDIPSIAEQQHIVDYLDKKLVAIDNRVEVLEKQKDAYARLKKSVINQAVTRGLNPDVKVKDSGIDWIGMIPEHWKMKRIKDLVSINNKSLGEDTDEAYKFRYIDISNVSSEGEVTLSDEMYYYDAPSRARRVVRKGDVIVSTVRTYLRAIARIDFDARDIIASTGFAVLTPTKCICSSYLAYLTRSTHIVDSICTQSTGVSYPAISSSRLSAIDMPLPPLSEQKAIADYLDEKCAKIDAAIENIEKQIKASGRLKKAIINEAISGGAI